MARGEQQRLWTAPFVLGTCANLAMASGYYMLMVVMTSYTMEVYQAPESIAAFTASVFIIGTLLARLISGMFMERVGRKRLGMLGAAFTIAFNAAYMVGTGVPLLMAIRFLHGFSYGVFSTCMATMITSIVPASRKGEGIGYYMLSVTIAAALGPFLGIFISAHFDFRILFILSIACSVLTLLCTALMKAAPSAPPQREGGAAQEALAEDLAGASVADAPELPREYDGAQRAEGSAEPAEPTASRLIDRLIEVRALPISCVCGLIFFGYSSLLAFLQPFAAEADLTRAASVFFIAYALAMFVTRPFTGRAFDRVGPRPVMVPAFISFAAGMVMLAAATNDWLLLGSALLCGFGVGTVQSCGLAMAVCQTTDDSRLSLANSTFYILLDTGVGVGPLVLGLAVPLIGYRLMYAALAGVALIGLASFLFITRRR